MRVVLIFAVAMLLVVSACSKMYTSREVCECQLREVGATNLWTEIDAPPDNYRRSEIRLAFDNDDPVYGTLELFDSADIHWYRNDSGQTNACIVFESSQRVNASLTLPADSSISTPIDFRIMGVPFGRYEGEYCNS